MEESRASVTLAFTAAQRRVVEHTDGAMLVDGPAGSGRTEALAGRLAHLAAAGTPPERVLVLARSRAGAARLRERAAALIDAPYEELWISTFESASERLLREYALEAGLDPFFATVRSVDRLAMLLDRLDQLSLRRHEIRGNPAGLLAKLLRRVEALKTEGIGPERLRDWAERREREAGGEAERELAAREHEFADFYASHDRVLRECGSLDAADLVIELGRLARERADVRVALADRFRFLIVDELEDAGLAHRAMIEALAAEHGNLVCACDRDQAIRRPPIAACDPQPSFMEAHPGAAHIVLDRPLRFGPSIARAASAVANLTRTSPAGKAEGQAVGASDEVAMQASDPAAPAAWQPAGTGREAEDSGGVIHAVAGE